MKTLKVTTANEVTIINVEEPLHISLREHVGGYIEIVNPRGLRHPFCMIVDEEGRLKYKPRNTVGCVLYETHKHGAPIVGDIVIMRTEQTDDGIDLVGLTDDDIVELALGIGKMLAIVLG